MRKLERIFRTSSADSVGSRVRLLSPGTGLQLVDKVTAAIGEDPARRFVIFLVDTELYSDLLEGAHRTAAAAFVSSFSNALENSHCSGVRTVFAGVLSHRLPDNPPSQPVSPTSVDDGLTEDILSVLQVHPKIIPIVISANVRHSKSLLNAYKAMEQRVNIAVIEDQLPAIAGAPTGWLNTAVERKLFARACVIGVDEMRLAQPWELAARASGMYIWSRARPWQEKKSTMVASLSGGPTGLVVNLDAVETLGPGSCAADGRLPLRDVFEMTGALSEGRVDLRFLHVSASDALREEPTSIGRAIARIVFNFTSACS